MGIIAPSYATISPNFTEPGLLVNINQASDFIDVYPGSAPEVKLGAEDKMVYLRHLAIRTQIATGQANGNQWPSVDIAADLGQAPTYLQVVRAEYDHHQMKQAGLWGFSLVDVQRDGMNQAHYQLLRDKTLIGIGSNEGLLNSAGITTLNLPADPNGSVRFSTYDNGAMAQLLLTLMQEIKAATFQGHVKAEFTILGPQRDVMAWEFQIVQLTSYQREGAGSATIAGTVKDILERNGDKVTFGYDDTLIGAGAGGNDAIIIVMPKLEQPSRTPWNTNEFGKVTPQFLNCTAIYSDVIAPIEIPTPLPGGAIDIQTELRSTSGWVPRPQAVTVLSGAY